jgi:hypothetical protein
MLYREGKQALSVGKPIHFKLFGGFFGLHNGRANVPQSVIFNHLFFILLIESLTQFVIFLCHSWNTPTNT